MARDTRVCVYDRAGRGWSEPADTPQDGAQIAADLHTLLHRAHVPGPYVLAGHSFGGLYVLTFAARYPDEVAGMVLVDSTAPAGGGTADRDSGEAPTTGSIASPRWPRSPPGWVWSAWSANSSTTACRRGPGDEVRAGTATAGSLRSTIDEYGQASASIQQAASLRDFADKPLVVLTAGVGHDAAWSAAQNHLATLSTNSVHRVVDGATHETLVADQEHAATTTQAILQVVSAVRSGGPVAR